ncbi:hypothetical protein DPMN_005312 [Dreissena polymorpha]|uniref:NuBaID C-terminal domain-containing protein n=1 Tax=Dreissena polymorpha TaxID=45954 RepID=A0A9D4RTS5_DREPO|nr:hypothetical protein DPMN_005312 [Dreissena polymorpha]
MSIVFSDSHENVLQCSLCRRKIGLWNYGLTEETETEHTNSVDVPDETSKGVLNGKHGKHSDTNVISDNNCKGVQNGDHGKTSDNGSINEDLLTRDTSVVSAKRGYEGAIEVEDVEGVTVEPAKKRPKLVCTEN